MVRFKLLIVYLQDQIQKLSKRYDEIVKHCDAETESLESDIKSLSKEFLKVRKDFEIEKKIYDKKIRLLSSSSYSILQLLEKICKKGDHIMNLSNTCKKFETEREKLCIYLPFQDLEEYRILTKDTQQAPNEKLVKGIFLCFVKP